MQYGNLQHNADERAYIVRTRLPDGTTARGRVLVIARNGAVAVNTVRARYPGRTAIGCYLADSPELARYNAEDGIPEQSCEDCGNVRPDAMPRAGRVLCGDCYTQWAGNGLPDCRPACPHPDMPGEIARTVTA